MQMFLLIIAVSIDVFLACMACGTEKIKIGNIAALCISGICSGVLFLALLAGRALDGIMMEKYTTALCFLALFLVGAFKLTEYAIRKYIQKYKFICKSVKISFSQLNFIFSIYNNPVMADKDHSATMSIAESVFFALAMSMDGFFGGLGAGFLKMNLWLTTLGNFFVSFLAVKLGCAAGIFASKRQKADLSWVGGVLFLVLAFSKIL